MRYQQQVNLYTQALRPKRSWFSLRDLLIANALIVVVMLGFYLLGVQTQQQLSAEQNTVNEQRDTLQAQVDVLTEQVNRSLSPRLEERQRRLGLEKQHLQQLLQLADASVQQDNYASEYLSALARQTPDGLWFTGIEITQQGAIIRLTGNLTHSALLPDLLENLSLEPVFANRNVEAIDVQRLTEPEGRARLVFSFNLVRTGLVGSGSNVSEGDE